MTDITAILTKWIWRATSRFIYTDQERFWAPWHKVMVGVMCGSTAKCEQNCPGA